MAFLVELDAQVCVPDQSPAYEEQRPHLPEVPKMPWLTLMLVLRIQLRQARVVRWRPAGSTLWVHRRFVVFSSVLLLRHYARRSMCARSGVLRELRDWDGTWTLRGPKVHNIRRCVDSSRSGLLGTTPELGRPEEDHRHRR